MQKYPVATDTSRSFNMKQIKGKNTSIERKLRNALWQAGIRYRKNYIKLPGKPDIVIAKYRIAIFCDGEFWHGKDWDRKRDKIRNNRDYWINKIERNIIRDNEINQKLCALGWTVIRFWGSEVMNNIDSCVNDIKEEIFNFVLDTYKNREMDICYFEAED